MSPRKSGPPKPPKPTPGKPRAARTPQPPRRPASPREPAFARAVLESIADPMVVYDAAWRVRYENAAAVRVFQAIGRASMLGRVLWEEFPDLEHSAFGREMRRAMDERVDTRFSGQRTGRSTWADVRCYPLPDGGIAAVWQDITEQKRAEHTLRFLAQSNALLGRSLDVGTACNALARLVVPEIADWCTISLLHDREVRLVAVAHVDESKVALARELDARYPVTLDSDSRTAHVIRTGKSELIPEVTDAMIDAAFPDREDNALVKSLGFSSAVTVPLTVGERVLGALSLVTTSASGRGPLGAADVSLAEQIGQRAAIAVDNAQLYEEAVAARAAAEQANAAKSAFLARMSHELRTPLNAIGGYADLLSMGLRGALTPGQATDVDRIKRNQMHLLALINDVLNYARLEAGRLQYVIQTVRVSDAVAAVDETFAPQFRERQLTFAMEVAEGTVVRADPEKLQQILFNLASNATKFTAPGGRISVSATESGSDVLIAVTDTGIGMPPERLESIFEPFVQLHVHGELAAGAGLGLAISRELARAMRGDLTVTSGPSGSTFTLRLPRP